MSNEVKKEWIPVAQRLDLELQLACCIRRAHEGPIGGRSFLEDKEKRANIGRLDPLNDYYWYTREACYTVARKLGLFFPNVISLYEHTTNQMSENVVREHSSSIWPDVQHPMLLISEIMDS